MIIPWVWSIPAALMTGKHNILLLPLLLLLVVVVVVVVVVICISNHCVDPTSYILISPPCYPAELSTAMPENGGKIIWVKKAFGNFWAFQTGKTHFLSLYISERYWRYSITLVFLSDIYIYIYIYT